MGAACTTRQLKPPEDIASFRNQSPSNRYVIPERSQNRDITDGKFTIAFGAFILLLVPFLIYTFISSDIDRFTHGQDKCGNLCGKQNPSVDGFPCSGEDKTAVPFLQYRRVPHAVDFDDRFLPDVCVENCSYNYQEILNSCFPLANRYHDEVLDIAEASNILSNIARDINKSAGKIVALSFIGLGLCLGMLCLFRYFPAHVVWFILIASMLGMVALTIFFWYKSKNSELGGLQLVAIVFTVISLALIIMVICVFKKIKLVIRLFKEAMKVVFGIPLILVLPILPLLAGSILLAICVYFYLLFDTSGYLTKVHFEIYNYEPNGLMMFGFYYHLVMCLWISQFIIGCQYMVVSGAVSAYFFARNKDTISSPIYNSFCNLIRFHLGTVAFGSLVITIIAIIKWLIRSLVRNRCTRVLVECCLGGIDAFLKYLSKNAYIQTAIHGQPFFKSGKRAARLLAANAMSVIALNSVGDFVLGMAKLLIVIITVGIGVALNDGETPHYWAAVLIAVFVTAILADSFFAVFETAIDTIFLCFCEDSCMNDGMSRPYYMSTSLMVYVKDAKKTVKDNN